jgi:hypothetical protein
MSFSSAGGNRGCSDNFGAPGGITGFSHSICSGVVLLFVILFYAIRNPFRAGRDDSRTDGGIRLVGSGRKFAAWYLLLHLFDIRDYRRRLARPVEREIHHSNWRQVFERGGSAGIAAIAAAIILAFYIRETGAAVRPLALSKPV